MHMYLALLCCLIAALRAANGSLQPICQPSSASNPSSPKLPNLPTAFSTLMEINIVNKNYTLAFEELYDQKADKGRIEITRNGTKHIDIYDYTLDEIIHVGHIDAKHCTVSSTSDKEHCHHSLFLTFFGCGSHIESVSELFKFGKEFNETYVGVSSVRGIRCHQWRACISTNYSSFFLDYYFSVPGWGTGWGMLNSTVVRAVANGTSVNHHGLNGTHDFYHVYDFFNFRPGPPDPSSFQLPEGLFCAGLKGANKTEPKVPPVFSMELELVLRGRVANRTQHVVSNLQEIYDLEKNLAMFKYSNWRSPGLGPVILIHDFNTGIGYNISSGHPGAECKPFNLTLAGLPKIWEGIDDGNHHIRMKTTQELFSTPRTNGSSTLVYKGSASVRGISADIWVGKTVMKRGNVTFEFVQEWYFSKPEWGVLSGYKNNQHQVPLRMDYFTPRGHMEINVFNFDAEAAEPNLFDIKPCFTWEEQRLVRFSLAAGKNEQYEASKEFILQLTKAISATANVSVIRVNGIRVLGYKDEEMVVSFILLERTESMGGDVEVVYSEKGLMDALDALNNSVESGNFKVQFGKKTFKAVTSSFFVGFKPTPPPPSQATPSSRPKPGGGISSGAAAGISILMLVVGIAGGLVIAHVIMKRCGTSLFSYQRQE